MPSTFGFHARTVTASLFLVAAFTCLYVLCSPSLEHQNWDSLSYASDCEVGNAKAIVGNHPLPHVVMHAVTGIARGLGYDGRALPLLVRFNSVVCGMAVGSLFILMVGVFEARVGIACGVSVLFGASATALRYAGTADIYSMVFLTAILAWFVIGVTYRQGACGQWIYAGVAVGVAVLFHQISVLLIGVCGLLAFGDHQHRWRNVAHVIVGAGVTVVVGYALAGWLATRSLQPQVLASWFLGYFQAGIYGRMTNFGFARMYEGVEYIGLALLVQPWNYVGSAFRLAFLSMTPVVLVVMLVWHWKRLRMQTLLVIAALSHALVGVVVVQWYEPWTEKFWLMVWLPVIIVVGVVVGCADRSQSEKSVWNWMWRYAFIGASASVAVFNVWFRGLPQRHDAPAFTEMLATWVAYTRPEDMLLTGGDGTAQLRFWADRPYATPLDNIVRPVGGTDPFEDMRAMIQARLDEGANVYITEGLERYSWHLACETGGPSKDEILRFFNAYPRESVFEYSSSIDGKILRVVRIIGSSVGTAHGCEKQL